MSHFLAKHCNYKVQLMLSVAYLSSVTRREFTVIKELNPPSCGYYGKVAQILDISYK